MPDVGRGIGDAARGAAAGSFLGPIGAVGGGVVGFLSGLFGGGQSKSDKFAKWREHLKRLRAEEIANNGRQMSEAISSLTRSTSSNAAERAIAAGRGGDAEAFAAPLTGKIATAGSETMRQLLTDTNRRFASEENRINEVETLTPDDPSPADYIGEVVDAAGTFMANKEYLKLAGQQPVQPGGITKPLIPQATNPQPLTEAEGLFPKPKNPFDIKPTPGSHSGVDMGLLRPVDRISKKPRRGAQRLIGDK